MQGALLVICLARLQDKGTSVSRGLRREHLQLGHDRIEHILSPLVADGNVLRMGCHIHTRVWNPHVTHNLQAGHLITTKVDWPVTQQSFKTPTCPKPKLEGSMLGWSQGPCKLAQECKHAGVSTGDRWI